MDKIVTCRLCLSTDDLQSVPYYSSSLHCWFCRFKINNHRKPLKYEIDIHNGVIHTCNGCSSTDDLKPSRHQNGALFCWDCRFQFNRERKPTQIEIDHHNGIIHSVTDLCKLCDHDNGIKHTATDMCRTCTPQECASDKLTNPKKYLTYSGEWPGGYSGNLLAWLVTELGSHSCADIAHVEVRGYNGKHYYKFEQKDFDISFNGGDGDIKELNDIIRFVMKDSSCYTVTETDGEYYATHLEYSPPVVTAIPLRTGLGKILKQKY